MASRILLSNGNFLRENAVANLAAVDEQAWMPPMLAELAAQPVDGLLDAVRVDLYCARWVSRHASVSALWRRFGALSSAVSSLASCAVSGMLLPLRLTVQVAGLNQRWFLRGRS